MLLVRQFDIEANRASAGFKGAFVSGLHNAGAATGYDGVAVLGELFAELFGEPTPFAVRGKASRAKYGDALREGAKFGEALFEVASVANGALDVLFV